MAATPQPGGFVAADRQAAPAGIGVEVGQILFIGVLLAAFWLIARVSQTGRSRAELALTYGIGEIGALWTLERLAIPFTSTV